FDGAVIQAKFINSKIEGINFFTAKRSLLSLSFDACLIRHSSFAELKLPKIKFTRCEFHNVDFSDADLSGADFSNSSFDECVFRNTNLSKADFRFASGYFIDPTQNKIRGAKFSSPDVLSLLASFEIEIG
ncbi:MAG: pentapeptide repeat-containing protein, partial [Candidatus Kapaibacterium sp.]